jgi:Fur family ferric uptake transcriptional regulator
VTGSDWQSDLRARGYRLTPQRQLVLQAVDTLEHATPDDILTEVRRTATGVNISTVYRTLELLEELNHHMHLVCRDCDQVTETDVALAAPFVESLRAAHGFETDMKHFAIFGRCAACSRKDPQ